MRREGEGFSKRILDDTLDDKQPLQILLFSSVYTAAIIHYDNIFIFEPL